MHGHARPPSLTVLLPDAIGEDTLDSVGAAGRLLGQNRRRRIAELIDPWWEDSGAVLLDGQSLGPMEGQF